MINVNFNEEKGILFAKYEGEITLYDIIAYINFTKLNREFPRDLKILSDARNAIFKIKPDDLDIVINENNKSLNKYNYIFDAILLDSPNETALSILYKRLAKNDKYKFEVFVSEANAISWLSRIENYYLSLQKA